MSSCAEQNLELLKVIGKSKNPKQIIKKASNRVIKALCECILNVIRGNVPITRTQREKLSSHKSCLRKLSDKKVPLYKKRRILVQKGDGFLSLLLPTAVSVISSLIHGAQ